MNIVVCLMKKKNVRNVSHYIIKNNIQWNDIIFIQNTFIIKYILDFFYLIFYFFLLNSLLIQKFQSFCFRKTIPKFLNCYHYYFTFKVFFLFFGAVFIIIIIIIIIITFLFISTTRSYLLLEIICLLSQ